MINILFNIVKGIIYGICSIIPGLSGGVIASYFGDYSKCISIIINRNFSLKNVLYVFSILLGIIFGITFFSKFIIYFYNNFQLIFLIFLILVNLTILIKICYQQKSNIKLFFQISILAFILFFIISKSTISYNFNNDFLKYVISAIIYSIAKVLPGISSTSILININFYNEIIHFYANPYKLFKQSCFEWTIFWIIFIIFSYILLKIVNKMFKNGWFNFFVYFVTCYNLFSLLYIFLESCI